ncbi:MAG: PAS domain-containing protein, partial [Mycobacteriales bacterium]
MDPRPGPQDAVVDALGAAAAGPRSALPRVLHDVPAAVLLVDLDSGDVVHANPAARRLVGPEVELPVKTAAWTLAARLTRTDGHQFGERGSPVDRAALGEAVFGEPLLVPTEDGTTPLWAAAIPLPGAAAQALVVLFEVDAAHPEALVRDRAVVAAGLSFTIADPRLEDCPLVWVNPAFERATGYTAEEAVGRNCRFLQGPGTDPATVRELARALKEEEHVVVVLLNYRKDGTAFWNELSMSPVYDADGVLTHVVGIQADVTSRVLAQEETTAHLAAERAARAEAERAQRRLALLAEATSMLAATLEVDESLERLASLVVPVLADFCTVDVMEPEGPRRVTSRHAEPEKVPLLEVIEKLQPTSLLPTSATARVMAGGDPVLLESLPEGYFDDKVDDPALRDAYDALGARSAIVVPLRARRQVLGVLAMFTSSS